MNRVLACARTPWLAAIALTVMIPAVAMAQDAPTPPPGPRCTIEVFREGCATTLCGPKGNFGYTWHGPGVQPGTEREPCITVKLGGTYELLIVDPRTGGSSTCRVTIGSCFNSPPDCSKARAKDPILWPPNHKLVPIEIEGVVDPDGDPVVIVVRSVTQDEPLDVEGDGSTCADAEIVDGQASVRAERTGNPDIPGNGRVYTLTFEASDGQGGRCKGQIKICVPHDMGQGDTCIDDGQLYDSLGACP